MRLNNNKNNIYPKNPKKNFDIQGYDKVTEQLVKIMTSTEFHATASQRKLFNFIISQTVSGKSHELKGYTIARKVFNRRDDFDPNSNPIVSIQAGKLRQALERYYLMAGQKDPLRIEIPKGSYLPVFINQIVPVTGLEKIDKDSDKIFMEKSPAVEILSFNNLTGDLENEIIGMGFASDLAIELSRYQEIKVLHATKEARQSVQKEIPRFTLYGNVYKNITDVKISCQLTDAKTGRHIWGDNYRMSIGAKTMLEFQEDTAQNIAVNLFDRHGIIPTRLFNESKNKPLDSLTAYEAILMFYEYDKTLTPEAFLNAMESLNHAIINHPDCGQVWFLLGQLYANIYGLGFSGFDTPLEKALKYAEKGIQISPADQRAWVILAFIYLLSDHVSLAKEAVSRALKLSSGSPLNADFFGYVMTLSGDWEKGTALIKKSMKRNPYYSPLVHYPLWVNCLRQKDYEGAYAETMKLQMPYLFWYPLVKASTLGLLGQSEKAEAYVNRLLELKPDFPSKGRILIGRYIKFKEIVDRVVKGLSKAGLNID